MIKHLYNFKCWNWSDSKSTGYIRAAVFAITEEIALIEIKAWLKRDEYVLFERYEHGKRITMPLKEFI
jgi:hypothetical protein